MGYGAHEQHVMQCRTFLRNTAPARQHLRLDYTHRNHNIRKSRFLHVDSRVVPQIPVLARHVLTQRPQQPPEYVPRLDLCIFLLSTAWRAVVVWLAKLVHGHRLCVRSDPGLTRGPLNTDV